MERAQKVKDKASTNMEKSLPHVLKASVPGARSRSSLSVLSCPRSCLHSANRVVILETRGTIISQPNPREGHAGRGLVLAAQKMRQATRDRE